MTTIRNLIDAIEGGNSQDIDDSFNSIMSAKVSDKIDAMRKDLAANMFKTAPADGEFDANSLEDMIPQEAE